MGLYSIRTAFCLGQTAQSSGSFVRATFGGRWGAAWLDRPERKSSGGV